MAKKELIVGHKVIVTKDMSVEGRKVEAGEILTISWTENSLGCQNFKAKETGDKTWPHQSVENYEPTFKIGDQVRCTGSMYGFVAFGEKATVTDVQGEHMELIRHGKKGNGFSYAMRNFELFQRPETTQPTTTATAVEVTTMKTTFRTTHYINETPIEDFCVEAQGDLIESLEAKIARLEAFGTKTKAIKAQIKEQKADLKKVVEQFDSLYTEE